MPAKPQTVAQVSDIITTASDSGMGPLLLVVGGLAIMGLLSGVLMGLVRYRSGGDDPPADEDSTDEDDPDKPSGGREHDKSEGPVEQGQADEFVWVEEENQRSATDGGKVQGEEKEASAEIDSTDDLPEPAVEESQEREEEGEQRTFDRLSEVQLADLAPGDVYEDPDNYEYLEVDGQYVRGYFVSGWPDVVSGGHLSSIFSQAAYDVTISVQVAPVPTREALDDLKEQISDLEAERQLRLDEGQTEDARDKKREIDEFRE